MDVNETLDLHVPLRFCRANRGNISNDFLACELLKVGYEPRPNDESHHDAVCFRRVPPLKTRVSSRLSCTNK